MIGAISIILVLGGLIFFHELGHFLMARAMGIGIKTFSIGFGPALLSWQGKKTRYQISAVPLGGYVSMVGENDAADIPAPFTLADSFSAKPAWRRLLVVVSGPFFNMMLAWLIFWGLFWAAGAFPLTEVGAVIDGSPAYKAGLLAGDLVKNVDGKPVESWLDLRRAIQAGEGKPVRLAVERGGQRLELDVRPEKLAPENQEQRTEAWGIGITSSDRLRQVGFFAAARLGLEETWRMTALIGQFAGRMFSGQGSIREIGGPVLVGQMVYQQAERGLDGLLYLTAFISVNLGLLNLLPIPALDGGHVFFCLAEIIFRRPVPQKIQTISVYAGFALLITIMLMATAFDIFRIFQ